MKQLLKGEFCKMKKEKKKTQKLPKIAFFHDLYNAQQVLNE